MHEPEANAQPSSMAPARIGAYFASRRRALVALAVALVAIGFWRMTGGASEGSPEASLAAVLARRGQTVDTASVLWLDRPSSGWRRVRAVWLGHAEGEPADVFAGDVRLKANGAVVDVAWVSNLTRTAGADETLLARLGDHVAYASRVDGKLEAVTVLDFAGEPVELTRDWPLRARLQNAITNLQETGRFRGVGRQRYRIVAPVERFSLAATARTFEAHVGAEAVIELDPRRTAPVRGADLVESRPAAKGMPGTISWVVDTVRNSPWVGREPIEWLEHTVFSAKDWAERKWYAIVGTDTEEAVAEELGVAQVSERTRIELSTTNVETGWPPAPMKPPLGKVKHEGEWMPVVNDPFVKARPGEPPLFYQSFLRVDPERDYTRVYVNVWDPRILELHIVAGTREPESATGETGTGMAPRDPAVLERVVAGFNGGFQALHGEFGMMAEGRVYLPPKPWAATVATYRDGSMAMGSWAGPPKGVREYEEQWAVAQIPTDMLGLRQNLTSVVEDGRYNPWERWWWGAAPLNADEQTLIDRSGLCLTTEGFLAYFWGQSMSADALGAAMLAARCVRGVHLDMNSAHTGFEYYNVSRTAFSPLGRELTDDEYDGPTPLAPSLFLRARRMVRTMSTMRFPRYIGRDARDFFYLTMRKTLPGAPVSTAASGGGPVPFSSDGMPASGYPAAMARARIPADAPPGEGTWLVRIDPRRVNGSAGAASGAESGAVDAGTPPEPIAYITDPEPQGATAALYAVDTPAGVVHRTGSPPAGARVLVRGRALTAEDTRAAAAIGVDADGFVLYVEREPKSHAPLVDAARAAGLVDGVLALGTGTRLAIRAGDGAFASPDEYARQVDPKRALAWVSNTRPVARVLNPDLKPLPYWRWARMQDARVRYFRDGPARFQMPADAGVSNGDVADAGVP